MKITRASLDDLPDFSTLSMKELDLTRNHLSSLDPMMLPRDLEVLILDRNRLSSDSFPARLPDTLRVLSLRENYIRNMDELEQLPSGCKILHLDMNRLESFSRISDSESLEVLTTERTDLERIARLPRNLQVWISNSSRIQMLPSRLPNSLRVLQLSSNCLKYAGLPRSWGTSLEELYLDHNDLVRLPQNLPASLRILNVASNRITEVPGPLPDKLEVFCATHNRIQEVHGITARKTPILLVDIRWNLLTESLVEKNRTVRSKWATTLLEDWNWSTPQHVANKSIIVKAWRRYRLRSRLHSSSAAWKRTRLVKEELFIVSMSPERYLQIDTLSPEWFRH